MKSDNGENGDNVDSIMTNDEIKMDRQTHCVTSVCAFEPREQLQEIIDTCLQHNDDDDDDDDDKRADVNMPLKSISSIDAKKTARAGQPGGRLHDLLLGQAGLPLKRSAVVSEELRSSEEERAILSSGARALSVDVDYPTPGQRTPPRLPTPVQVDRPQRLTAAQEADALE